MPNPLQVPLISGGSDPFGGLNAQRFGWAGFNNRIDEGNIARADAAEQQRNNWLLTVANMQRQDAARADALSSREQEVTINRLDNAKATADAAARYAAQTAEDKRRFDINAKFSEKQLASGEELAGNKLKLKTALDEAAIDHHGQNFAQSYAEAERAQKIAKEENERLQSEMESNDTRLAALTAKKSKDLTPAESAEQTALQSRKNEFKRLSKDASSTLKKVDYKFDKVYSNILAHDYDVDEDSGAVIHTPTGRKFNFRAPKPPVQIAPPGDEGAAAQYDWFHAPPPGELPGTQSSAPWAGFAGAQGGLTATNQPVQIGRFKVNAL